MKRSLLIITLVLSLTTVLPLLFSCGKQPAFSGVITTPDSSLETEAPAEVSEVGKVEFSVLGVRTVDSFGNVTPAEGNSIVCVYVEAVNKSTADHYVKRNCLDTANSDLLYIDEDQLPEGYDNFGGYIGSGKRRLFLLCFEEKTEWFRISLNYSSFDKNVWNAIMMGKDYREEKEFLPDHPEYPIDERGAEDLKADFEILKERFIGRYWGTPSDKNVKKYEDLLAKTDKGSYFTNVDYKSDRAASWPTANHLKYLKNLISAYGEERLKADAEARETALSALDYWLKNDFQCSTNWYCQEISTPRDLVACGLMLRPYLDDARCEKIDEIVGRGTLRGSSKASSYTGSNLMDMMETTVFHAIFVDDFDLALSAVARSAQEVRIVKRGAEGMQADGTFFQHGAMLHTAGGYGSVYAVRVSTFISELYGTKFSLPEENIKIFVDHILDGHRYFHRGLGTTYFSIGRSAVYSKGANEIEKAVKQLLELDGIYRKDELEAYAKTFADPSLSFDSMKFFPHAYTLVDSAPEYYMAVKGAHKDFILTEAIIGQNELGYNLSYGSNTCYMYYGDEYKAIGAVMDLAMFPGTTAFHETEAQLQARYKSGYNKTWGKSTYTGDHCGGLTDTEKGVGVLYMELLNDGIKGKLSYVTFDGVTVALGAGLNYSKTTNTDIRTTIDQSKFNNAMIGQNALTVGSKPASVTNETVYNGAFAYYNLGEGTLTAEAKSMTGSYSRNNAAGETQKETHDVFQLYISHGTKLDNASYAYAVAANADGSAPKTADGLKIKKITNAPELQAVELDDGRAAVVFHKAGSFTLSSGETVTATEAKIIIK